LSSKREEGAQKGKETASISFHSLQRIVTYQEVISDFGNWGRFPCIVFTVMAGLVPAIHAVMLQTRCRPVHVVPFNPFENMRVLPFLGNRCGEAEPRGWP
jgi:hypothetical protein